MKTSEVFKALEKNPKQIYEINDTVLGIKRRMWREGEFFSYGIIGKYGVLKQEELLPGERFFGNIQIDDDWQLVRTPVPWQEAIQAVLDGKKVTCECKECSDTPDKCTYKLNDSICTDGIKSGTWFIIEGSEAND